MLAGETVGPTLAPPVWKAEHSASIRSYRQDERRQAADSRTSQRIGLSHAGNML